MDGVLEKITLYDILSYWVPGSTLMLLLLMGTDQRALLNYLKQWEDYKGGLYLLFFLTSYLGGIVLSEIMTWLWKGLERFGKSGTHSGGGTADGQEKKKVKRNGQKIEEKITVSQMTEALKRSGVYDSKETIESRIKENFRGYYMGYIYGIVQKNEQCKRIHNYASAYVLYKNVAGALAIGAIFTVYNGAVSGWLGLGYILVSLLFVIRAIRFRNKKNNYAILWFVEMFTRLSAEQEKG